MEYRFLKSEVRENGIVVLTLANPASLNALNSATLQEINHFVMNLPENASLLVITGEGKAFVAGADISEMADFNAQQGLNFGRFGSEVFRRIEDLNIPVIAAINGFALGGGCELAMACDIRIASAKARFGQPEVKLGIIPGFSGTYRLSKLVGQGYAKEMIYSGRMIDAAEALRVGLVNHVVEPEELMPYVNSLAEDIVANAPVAVRYAKECINRNYDMSETDGIELESQLFSKCFDTEDQKHGMKAFMEKTKPEFKNR